MIGSTQRSAHASSWWTHSRDDLSTPEIDHFLGRAFPDTEMNLLVRALIGRTVLDDVSVAVLPVVLGAAGAGKTTLLDLVGAVMRHGRGGRERRVSDVHHMGHVERMVEVKLQPSVILLDEGPAAVDSFAAEMPEPTAEKAADIALAEERSRIEGTWILARAAQRKDLVSRGGRRYTVWAAADGDTIPDWVPNLKKLGAAGGLVSLPITGIAASVDDETSSDRAPGLREPRFVEEAPAFAVKAVFAYTQALCDDLLHDAMPAQARLLSDTHTGSGDDS